MEKAHTGRKRFFSAVTETINLITSSIIKNHPEQYMEASINHLFGLDGPHSIAREPAAEEQFAYKVFFELKEIFESYERLMDIGLYIRRFPFSGTRVTRTRYLRTQIEAYLQEVYVLKERLIRFLGRLEKWYKDDYDERTLKAVTKPLGDAVENALRQVIDIRASHVHDARYQDKTLAWIIHGPALGG